MAKSFKKHRNLSTIRFIIRNMNDSLTRRYDHLVLLAFAFTAVASIALQNLIWISITLFFFTAWRNHQKIEWPRNEFAIATLIFLASFYYGCIVGVNPAKSFESVHKYLVFLILFPVGAMSLTFIDIRRDASHFYRRNFHMRYLRHHQILCLSSG